MLAYPYMRFDFDCLKKSPQWELAGKIHQKLRDSGHLTYLAGGSVRDAHLGVVAKDLDLVTDATGESIKSLFPNVILVGESFGVYRIHDQGQEIELARFRKESDYRDGRHPEKVEPASPREDSQRRDFTMNGLFYDLDRSIVIDYVEGLKDLEQGIIRCIGEPEARFREDHLRMLRALRFAAQLGFEIEEQTLRAIRRLVQLLESVSLERIQQELTRILISKRAWAGIKSCHELGLLKIMFPEVDQDFLLRASMQEKLFSRKVDDVDLALCLFLIGTPNPEITFRKLRWPKKSQQAILNALSTFNDWPVFFHQRPGLRLKAFANPVVRGAAEIWKESSGHFKQEVESVLQDWKRVALADQLPVPLVRAQDLPQLRGEDLGAALRELYLLQIENPHWSKGTLLEKLPH